VTETPRIPLTLAQVEATARAAHSGQTDKAGRPYAEHLQAVAEGVRVRGGDEEQIAVTKRAGEPPEAYAARILATPGALLVKESDLAHNADPARLAVLDEATRTRLTEKYARMGALLGLVG
jgi:hypothetical protein